MVSDSVSIKSKVVVAVVVFRPPRHDSPRGQESCCCGTCGWAGGGGGRGGCAAAWPKGERLRGCRVMFASRRSADGSVTWTSLCLGGRGGNYVLRHMVGEAHAAATYPTRRNSLEFQPSLSLSCFAHLDQGISIAPGRYLGEIEMALVIHARIQPVFLCIFYA